MNDIKDRIVSALIDKYGQRAQMIKFVEEAAELIQKLSKLLLLSPPIHLVQPNNDLKNATRHEIVDVMITLHSLTLIFGKDLIEKICNEKLKELTITHNL